MTTPAMKKAIALGAMRPTWRIVSASGVIAEASTERLARNVALTTSRADDCKAAVYDRFGRPRHLYSKGAYIPRRIWKHAPERLLPNVGRDV